MALAIQDRYEGYGCKVQYTIGSDENPKGKKYLFTHIASDHTDEQLLKFAEAVEMLFDGFLLEAMQLMVSAHLMQSEGADMLAIPLGAKYVTTTEESVYSED